MKVCPLCDTRFDEDVIVFCTKDGTPLVDEAKPIFSALPSDPIDEPDIDFGEETIVRRRPEDVPVIPSVYDLPQAGERIVISTDPTPTPGQQVRTRTTEVYAPPPQQPNTAKTVVLTILGTLVVLGFGAGLFWFLQKESPANANIGKNANVNQNVNLNTNLGFDSNFNFNSAGSFNTNFNMPTSLSTNIKTPTPTPTPRPSPSPSPGVSPAVSPSVTPAVSPTPRATPANRADTDPKPTPTSTPRIGPRPPPLVINRPPGNQN